MCKVIAIANQKGGVAKTTSAVSLGVGIVNKGNKVLIIDCDPQGSCTVALGYQEREIKSIYPELKPLIGQAEEQEIIKKALQLLLRG